MDRLGDLLVAGAGGLGIHDAMTKVLVEEPETDVLQRLAHRRDLGVVVLVERVPAHGELLVAAIVDTRLDLEIGGMSCASRAARVEKELAKVPRAVSTSRCWTRPAP